MKQSRTKDIFVLGFAMFAIFFGAGNLIFPPSIGINTGEDVIFGIAGMTLTGILFPMLAMYAVVNMGTDFHDLSYHINSWWHQLFRGIGLLIVLFGTIPRCGAVAAETGLRGIAPDLPDWANVVFLVAFFALSYFFASNRSKVVDMIGTYATPILLIALLIIVVMVFAIPIGSPTGGTVDNAFSYSMLTAYNTGDIPTGLICAGVFLGSVKEKGYTLKDTYNMGYASDPKTLDALATSRSADSEAIVNTYDGLVEYDNENEIKPALAESWEVSEDGKTYTFHIRQGAKWVDAQGREVADVKADDFVASMCLRAAAASSVRFRWSHSWAYSWPYLTNIPAMKTLSATGPSLGPVIWKLSPGCSEKQFRFRQSFQSARPMSGRPWGPRWVQVKLKLRRRCSIRVCALVASLSKGTCSSRIDQSPVSRR